VVGALHKQRHRSRTQSLPRPPPLLLSPLVVVVVVACHQRPQHIICTAHTTIIIIITHPRRHRLSRQAINYTNMANIITSTLNITNCTIIIITNSTNTITSVHRHRLA
jgi:hypothetical protein